MKAFATGMIALVGLVAGCDSASDHAGTPDGSADAGSPDASDASVDGDACPPPPAGCVEACLDEDGQDTEPWGVGRRGCEWVTGEDGCPDIAQTTEDCRPGVCHVYAYLAAHCLPPVECEATPCPCPNGSSCNCALDGCTVSCEGDCIVTLSGDNGTVECADDAWCRTGCTGSSCTTNCATGSTCTQDCDGAACLLACDAAQSCSQQCNGTACHVECETASECSQDCQAPGECTCYGCP